LSRVNSELPTKLRNEENHDVLAGLLLVALVGVAYGAGPFDGVFLRYSSAKVAQYTIKIVTDDDARTVIGTFLDGPYSGKTHLNTSLVYENDGAAGVINTFDPTTNVTVLQAPFSIGVSPDEGTLVGISQDAEQAPYIYEGKVFFYVRKTANMAPSFRSPLRFIMQNDAYRLRA